MIRRLLVLLLFFGVGFLMLGFLQRKMIYYPTSVLEMTPSHVGLAYQDVSILTRDGVRLHGWFIPREGARVTLLFLHGNAGNIGDRVDNLKLLHDLGVQVCIIDYRGYGLSEGSPSEQGLYRDAEAAFAFLISRQDVDPGRVAVFGRSLGAAVAVDLCSGVDCWRLVLEGAFSSAGDMARQILPFVPLGRILPEKFAAIEKIGKVKAPLLQFHGTRDKVVPYELGLRLFQEAGTAREFVPVAGGSHNDTWVVGGGEYAEKLRSFLVEDPHPPAQPGAP